MRVALALILGVSGPLHAQAVTGQLVDRATGMPVAGAFLTLIDGGGLEVARVLTGDGGTFLLRAPATGMYRLRSKRIGFRMWESTSMTLTDSQTVHFRLELDAVPVRLPAVVVSGRPQCGTRGEQGTAVAQLWEEAREALAAVQWTLDEAAYRYTLERFDRERPAVSQPVVAERRATWSGYFHRPFGSIPAQDLARRGYVVAASRDSVDYYGPDAEVLLGDVFVNTHCFSARAGVGRRAGLVGLAFEPAPGRALPDVEGVLWLAENTLELQFLEFSYTQLRLPPDLPKGTVGGYVEFTRLPTGACVVKHWWIRTARLGRYTYPWPNITGFRETGGQVLMVTSSTGAPVYAAAEALLEGDVVDSTREGAPLARAVVRLAGTDREAVTDERGHFLLSAPVDGEYGLSYAHSRLDSLGLHLQNTVVRLVRGARTTVTLVIPPEPEVVTGLCPDGLRAGERVIVGVARDADGEVVPAAGIHVQLSGRGQELVGEADPAGRFVVCGVPAEELALWATVGQGRSFTVILEFGESGVWIDQKQFKSLPGRIWMQDLQFPR